MTTGERMKLRRKEIGLSAEKVAELLGISPATIYRYENGAIDKVPGDRLGPIAKALQTTPAYLMGWDENNPPIQVDEGIWESICADETKLSLATVIAELDNDRLTQVAKVLAAILGTEIPPSALR